MPDPPVITVALNEQVRPVLGVIDVDKVTGPEKPLIGEIVMVLVPVTPEFTTTVVGLADIAKSCGPVTMKVIFAECERVPLVPITEAVKLPVDMDEHDSVEVPEPLAILVGESVQRRLVELTTVRETVPVKPFTGATVIVEVPELPWTIETLVGFAEIVKS